MWQEMTSRSDLIAQIHRAGIEPKKSLGQNFLVEPMVLEQITKTAELGADDTVLEIGPGLGFLTKFLLDKTEHVTVVEADGRMVERLRKLYPKVQIIHGDFLQEDFTDMTNYKVVANLPYYITSLIFRKLLNAPHRPNSITALVQKEVAERICAPVGKLSVLALSISYYGQASYIATVPAHDFAPTPKVDSAIIHIQVYDRPVFEADEKQLFRLIKAGFGEKRKMLRNALAGGLQLTPDAVAAILASAGVALTARAQELSLADWNQLYNAWQKNNS